MTPPRKRVSKAVPPVDFGKIAEETDMAFGRRGGNPSTVEEPVVVAPAFQEPDFTYPVESAPVAETTTYEENSDMARQKTTYDEPVAVEVQSEVTDTETVEPYMGTPDGEEYQPLKPSAEQNEAKIDKRKGPRGPRTPINVGNVVVRPSSRTDFRTRTTPTKANPVFKAVEAAELDTPTDILVENEESKIKGAISILRRAGAQLDVAMHIAPKDVNGYPTEIVEGIEYAVITFKTGAERQLRGRKKTEVAASQ